MNSRKPMANKLRNDSLHEQLPAFTEKPSISTILKMKI
jgi:hypothetical protein